MGKRKQPISSTNQGAATKRLREASPPSTVQPTSSVQLASRTTRNRSAVARAQAKVARPSATSSNKPPSTSNPALTSTGKTKVKEAPVATAAHSKVTKASVATQARSKNAPASTPAASKICKPSTARDPAPSIPHIADKAAQAAHILASLSAPATAVSTAGEIVHASRTLAHLGAPIATTDEALHAAHILAGLGAPTATPTCAPPAAPAAADKNLAAKNPATLSSTVLDLHGHIQGEEYPIHRAKKADTIRIKGATVCGAAGLMAYIQPRRAIIRRESLSASSSSSPPSAPSSSLPPSAPPSSSPPSAPSSSRPSASSSELSSAPSSAVSPPPSSVLSSASSSRPSASSSALSSAPSSAVSPPPSSVLSSASSSAPPSTPPYLQVPDSTTRLVIHCDMGSLFIPSRAQELVVVLHGELELTPLTDYLLSLRHCNNVVLVVEDSAVMLATSAAHAWLRVRTHSQHCRVLGDEAYKVENFDGSI
ncbi:unnamed protein product [Cutaneotrichosporon oleaginosum]